MNVNGCFIIREKYSLESKGYFSHPSISNSLGSPHTWVFSLLETVITRVNFPVAFQMIAKLFCKEILGGKCINGL